MRVLDDDGDDDGRPVGPPLPPEDRLWRHPSEMWTATAAARPAPRRRARMWPSLVLAGLCGAAMATSVVTLATGLSRGERDRGEIALVPEDAPLDGGAVDGTTGLLDRMAARLAQALGRTEGSSVAVPDQPQPWLGVQVVDLPPEEAAARGVTGGAYVVAVAPDSPAAAAGLAEADVIVAFEDEPVASAPELVERVARCAPGDAADLRVDRSGTSHELTATLQPRERSATTTTTTQPVAVRDSQRSSPTTATTAPVSGGCDGGAG